MKKLMSSLIITIVLASGVFAQGSTSDQQVDSLQRELLAIKDRLDGLSENMSTVNSDLAILKWLKVSGYLQARWEVIDTLANFDKAGPDAFRNNTSSNIYIRRGRIKFTIQPNQSSRYVIYFDASKNSVSLKEAYVDLIKNINGHEGMLTVGQMNWPFGYEIEYSSSKRDFPERSAAERALFPGERDRGINFTYTAPKYFSANLGVFQGFGIDNTTFTWWDPTKQKDIIARAKVKLGMLDLGVSGYFGDNFIPGSAAVAGSSTWFDANGNNAIDPGEVKTTAAKGAVNGIVADKNRLGADAQLYLDVLPIGATAIRTEYFWAEDYDKSVTQDSLASRQGWYLWLSQTISTKWGAAARYDYWDPNTETASNDATGTWSFALHYFYDANVRITAAYDMPRKLAGQSTFKALKNEPQDNRFTLQFQFAL